MEQEPFAHRLTMSPQITAVIIMPKLTQSVAAGCLCIARRQAHFLRFDTYKLSKEYAASFLYHH